MNDDIGKTVKLFLFWCFLYFAPIIIGTIVGRIYKNDAIIGWTMLLACLLNIFIFFGKRYVKLSFGRIERRMVWPVVGMTILIAVVFVFVEHSVYALLDVYRLFSDETEQGNDFSQRFFAEILGILYGGIFGPIAEEIGFRGVSSWRSAKDPVSSMAGYSNLCTCIWFASRDWGAFFRSHVVWNHGRLALLAHRQHYPWHHYPCCQQFSFFH